MPDLTLRDVPEWTTADELTEFCRAAWSDEYAELSLPDYRYSVVDDIRFPVSLVTDKEYAANAYRRDREGDGESRYANYAEAVRSRFEPYFAMEVDNRIDDRRRLTEGPMPFGVPILRDIPVIQTTTGSEPETLVEFREEGGVLIGEVIHYQLTSGPWHVEELMDGGPRDSDNIRNPDEPLSGA